MAVSTASAPAMQTRPVPLVTSVLVAVASAQASLAVLKVPLVSTQLTRSPLDILPASMLCIPIWLMSPAISGAKVSSTIATMPRPTTDPTSPARFPTLPSPPIFIANLPDCVGFGLYQVRGGWQLLRVRWTRG